jgi:hypothetical protein
MTGATLMEMRCCADDGANDPQTRVRTKVVLTASNRNRARPPRSKAPIALPPQIPASPKSRPSAIGAGRTTPCSNRAPDQLIFFWITEVAVMTDYFSARRGSDPRSSSTHQLRRKRGKGLSQISKRRMARVLIVPCNQNRREWRNL